MKEGKNMIKYKVGKNLKADVLMIFRCLGVLDVPFSCHEGTGIFYNVLKKFGYKVEVVRGFYSSPYLDNGERRQHSWVENIIDPYGYIIIETVPNQVFPELSPKEQIRSMIILPDDEKRQRYYPIQESLMKKILGKSGVNIDKKTIYRLSHTIIKTFEKRSAKEKK